VNKSEFSETLKVGDQTFRIVSLARFSEYGHCDVESLPLTIRILLEASLRRVATGQGGGEAEATVQRLAAWPEGVGTPATVQFCPTRVLLQDFTGTPVLVELAALRSAIDRRGGDAKRVDLAVPSDFVIDHSVEVERSGSLDAVSFNLEMEYARNTERFEFIKWAESTFNGLRIVPSGSGIMHQINLEYLASVVTAYDCNGEIWACPDSVLGTDSHTTMINGLGIFGLGIGGIEAAAVMLGQPVEFTQPEVIGVRLDHALNPGISATDAVLSITRDLRTAGVVGAYLEYYGEGVKTLSLEDRATIANMAPEAGARIGFFPFDNTSLQYLKLTGRQTDQIALVDRYLKEQGLFGNRTDESVSYSRIISIDLGSVEAVVAGPSLPTQVHPVSEIKGSFDEWMRQSRSEGVSPSLTSGIRHGDVALASITSCTNTSNPAAIIAAGLVAKRAVESGLTVPSHVKASFAPGSKVVVDYLDSAGLMPFLEELGFGVVGFGCTTCAGGSGPLKPQVAQAVDEDGIVVAAVLSGNRNFEGRIHHQCRTAYLASPALVVAFALAGTVDIDFSKDPVGVTGNGELVRLEDLMPSGAEVADTAEQSVDQEMFRFQYASIFEGDAKWSALSSPAGITFPWDDTSTYIREPPIAASSLESRGDLDRARCLLVLGDSVTTDHISPAGEILPETPAGQYLSRLGVGQAEFNRLGARRTNHEVMTRGTFGNPRLTNGLVGKEDGGCTRHIPSGEVAPIFDVAGRYRNEETNLIVLAGEDYGIGSSRDWAAKGTALLGIRAVIANSYESIHRSNLAKMGVLSLRFKPGEGINELDLTGEEEFNINGVNSRNLQATREITVYAIREGFCDKQFNVIVDLYGDIEFACYEHGGMFPMLLNSLLLRV